MAFQHDETRGRRTTLRTGAVLVAAVVLCVPAGVSADGVYTIGRDDGGVYFQTDNDGSWYIPDRDRGQFRVGQGGRYRIRREGDGARLTVDGGKTFLLGGVPESASEEAIDAFNRAQNERLAAGSETPVVIRGNQVLLPVRVTHQGRRTEVLLLLDTGASLLTLHREAAERIGIEPTRTARFRMADGNAVEAGIVRLGEVRFGPFRKTDVTAGILPHLDPSAGYDGLLGMNVLQDVGFQIDFERQVIRWRG